MPSIQSVIDIFQTLFQSSESVDEEIEQLTKTIRKTMGMQKREVKGIGDIVFTVGKKETKNFQEENEARRARGESYFLRVKNDVGAKEQLVVIWIKILTDREEFMTELVLGSTQPNHEHFFFGDKDGYQTIVHPEMRGMGASDPTLCFWFKKESQKSRHICDLRVSYTTEDRVDLTRKNYEMLPLCLSKFGLGYANVWIQWTSSQMLRLTNSDHLEKELKDYRVMLDKSPEDPILIKMVDQAQRRLREVQLQEEDHAKDIPGDDLVYTKEFLALDQNELERMCSIFRKSIDFDGDGKISIEDYALFLREPLSISPFIQQIFALPSATHEHRKSGKYSNNSSPKHDMGSTLKATAVFCMLSSSDLLKCIFAWYDTKGYGVIENGEFLQLLGLFNPRHRDDRVIRALKEIDIQEDGTMSFSTFEAFNKRFPHLLYPAFRVQEKMREMFMGVRWWRRKQGKYAKAKELLMIQERAAEMVESMERKQRYEIAQQLTEEGADFFEMKKQRKRRFMK